MTDLYHNGQKLNLNIENFRFVVYDKEIHHIRNVKSFLAYHREHPHALKNLLRNAQYALALPADELDEMRKCKANMHLDWPKGKPEAGTMYRAQFPRPLPVYILLEPSIQWLKGLIIEAYGLKGFDVIKEALK